MSLFVKNPHSILAALRSRPSEVEEVLPPKGGLQGVWAEIGKFSLPKKGKKAPVGPEGRQSGSGAWMKQKSPLSVEELMAHPKEGQVFLALDQLHDPQNVGALFRSAAFFGVSGILMTEERSAPMSGTVYDIASGGVESVPYSLETNLSRCLEIAKRQGLWILGTSEHASQSYRSVQRDRAWLVVLGNEEKGIRRLTEETCDVLCAIPARHEVGSLNVSVAGGILLSHLLSD